MWKTKLARKVMTVQNCSMKGLPKRLVARTPDRKSFVLFELSNVCELLVMVATASMLPRMTVSVASGPTERPPISGS